MIVQGDVFFTRTKDIPMEAHVVTPGARGYIIAEGEATGHAHVIRDDIELYKKDGVLYIQAPRKVEVSHEEHLPVTLSPGIWKVGIVQEYDPFAEEARKVRD